MPRLRFRRFDGGLLCISRPGGRTPSSIGASSFALGFIFAQYVWNTADPTCGLFLHVSEERVVSIIRLTCRVDFGT